MEVLPGHILERVQVPARRAAGLGPGDVESDHALVAVAYRKLGDLQRAGRGPHRGEQGVDGDAPPGAAAPESLQHRVHDLVEAEPAGDVQLRGEPHLGIDDAVGGEILRALGRHPDQRIPGLHHADRVLECLQVKLQLPAARDGGHPPGQLADVVGGQPLVAGLAGQLHDGLRPQPAIEVIVQQHLGDRAELLDRQGHASIITLGVPPGMAGRYA